MKQETDYIVYIGRFQPCHLAHIEVMKQALQKAEKLIVLVGSAMQPRTHKNPFTWQERSEMIYQSLPKDLRDRVIIMPQRDIMYNDPAWTKSVQDTVNAVAGIDKTVRIIGHSKDETSYYLEMFPQWGPVIDVGNIEDMHAKDIRVAYFTASNENDFDMKIGRNLPVGIHDWLKAFMIKPEYDNLREAYEFDVKIWRSWDWNATLDAFLANEALHLPSNASPTTVIETLRNAYTVAKYNNNFYCADSVVVQSGHVLLVKRRSNPGKDLWAIPGGHIHSDEVSLDGAIRELREETLLKVPEAVLYGSLDKDKPTKLFEKPNRSLRGRTLSKAYHFVLKPGPLPPVKGSDDAKKAKWVPLSTLARMEDQMFEDHWHIINYFLGT